MGRSRSSSTFQARRPSKPLSRVVVDGGGKRQKRSPAEVAVKSKTGIRGGGGGGGSAGGQSNRKKGGKSTTSSDADDDAGPEVDEELSESGEEEVGSEDESQEEEEEEEERLPYGLMRHNLDEMSDDMAAMLYERDQVLWVHLSAKDRAKCKSPSALLAKLHKANPALFTTQWSVENAGMVNLCSLLYSEVQLIFKRHHHHHHHHLLILILILILILPLECNHLPRQAPCLRISKNLLTLCHVPAQGRTRRKPCLRTQSSHLQVLAVKWGRSTSLLCCKRMIPASKSSSTECPLRAPSSSPRWQSTTTECGSSWAETRLLTRLQR